MKLDINARGYMVLPNGEFGEGKQRLNNFKEVNIYSKKMTGKSCFEDRKYEDGFGYKKGQKHNRAKVSQDTRKQVEEYQKGL